MQTTLYCQQGSSDKVNTVSAHPQDLRFVVNFAHGRRNTTLETCTKTDAPVSLDEPQILCKKAVKEKKAKGYIEDPAFGFMQTQFHSTNYVAIWHKFCKCLAQIVGN